MKGYLALDGDKLVLFADEAAYRDSAFTEAVFLDMPLPPALAPRLTEWEGLPGVSVIGVFDARFVGFGVMGLLSDIENMSKGTEDFVRPSN